MGSTELIAQAINNLTGPGRATAATIAESLQDAPKFKVRIKTSIEYAFTEDEAGTLRGAGFLVDDSNGYIVNNAHVSGRGNARIEVAFKGQPCENTKTTSTEAAFKLSD